jgi:hypothetical protein
MGGIFPGSKESDAGIAHGNCGTHALRQPSPAMSVLSVASAPRIGDPSAQFGWATCRSIWGLTVNPSISSRLLCLLRCPGHSCA